MFEMMNHARFSVGVQGLAVSERAYQQSKMYAFDRVQGIAQGLDKSLEIINETVEKYKEGDLDDQ